MIVHNENKRPRAMQPGITHTVIAHADDMMLCEVSLDAGVVMAAHSHPHRQAIYVISGAITLTMEGQEIELKAGESVMIEPDQAHGVTAVETSRVLDVFTPTRQDFLPYAPR